MVNRWLLLLRVVNRAGLFGLGSGSGRVRAYIFGFGPELVIPFTTLRGLTMYLLRLPTYSPGTDFRCAGPQALGKFRNIFLPSIGKDRRKVLPLEGGAPRNVPYGKTAPGYYLTFMKRLNEFLR